MAQEEGVYDEITEEEVEEIWKNGDSDENEKMD